MRNTVTALSHTKARLEVKSLHNYIDSEILFIKEKRGAASQCSVQDSNDAHWIFQSSYDVLLISHVLPSSSYNVL